MMILHRLLTRARLAAAVILLSTFGLAGTAHASPITFNGELTNSSPVVDFSSALYHYELHTFTVAFNDTINFSMQGFGFDPTLAIYADGQVDSWAGAGILGDPKIGALDELVFAFGGSSLNGDVILVAGTYQVMASSFFAVASGEPFLGEYSITLSGGGVTAVPIASTALLMGGGLLGLGLVINGQRRRSSTQIAQHRSTAPA